MRKLKVGRESGGFRRFRLGVGLAGCFIAAFFFVWFVLGAVPGIPSMLDVFGTTGMRTPAAITIGGLLLAAIGFFEA